MLTRVNSFSGNIAGQRDMILPISTMHSIFTIIVNKYQTYNIIQLIINARFTFMVKNE